MVAQVFVLAGGASKRFGSSKARHVFEGEPLVSRLANRAIESGLEPVLLVKDRELEDLGYRLCVEPAAEGYYPLRAILHALRSLPEGGSALFVPCDLPFLRVQSFLSLAEQPWPTVAWDGKRTQPLLAHFAREQAPALENWVNHQGSARGFVESAGRLRLPASELRNINRPEDLVSV